VKITKELLEAVSQLQIRAKRNVTTLLTGNYRTAFRGSGMQFKEFRHYEPGDDVRHMSWPVTARTGRATIKTYEEERELDVMILVDVSGSSLFGLSRKRKVDMYAELVALIGMAAIRSGDSVGALLFSDKPGRYFQPRKAQSQLLVTLGEILAQPFDGAGSDLRPAFGYLQNVLKNRSLIVVLSDFWVPAFEKELRQLSRKHEIVLLHCYDDAERGYGLSGVYEVRDPETGQYTLLDGNSKKTKRLLSEQHTNLSNTLEKVGRTCRADYLSLSVEDDYLQRLVNFFKRRGPSRL